MPKVHAGCAQNGAVLGHDTYVHDGVGVVNDGLFPCGPAAAGRATGDDSQCGQDSKQVSHAAKIAKKGHSLI